MTKELVALLIPIACGCILPIVLIWLEVRRKMNDTNKRTQIVLAALEKNPEMDIEDFLKKMAPKQKLLKEKLLSRLLWGCLTSLIGLGLVGFGIYLNVNHLGGSNDPMTAVCFGLVLLAIGIAFLINYGIGKKMLAKEIEAEEARLITQP